MLANYETALPSVKLTQEQLAPQINKIAVLRANQLGDFIVALPALQALRGEFPQAEIVLLGQEWHARFLAGRSSPVDRVVVVPAIREITGAESEPDAPEQVEQFFEEMAREGFDLAVQLHGDGLHSNDFIQRLGARLTIGARKPEAKPLDLWVPYSENQSEIMRILEVVSLVGARAQALEPHLKVIEADLVEASRFLPEPGDPLVVISPGGQNSRARWPAEKFAAVADALAFTGAQVALIGEPGEESFASRVERQMVARPANLCGRLSLSGLSGLMSQARLVISNDTDYLRLAWGVGALTVGIYWFANLLTNAPLIRSRHRPAISWRTRCPVCGLDSIRFSCDHEASFLEDVTVVEVLTSALDLLVAERRPGEQLA